MSWAIVPLMPGAAIDANQQLAKLRQRIQTAKADGVVTGAEAAAVLRQAKLGGVQGAELQQLRSLALSAALKPAAKDAFVTAVDKLVPAGAPTAQLAAILFRLNPDTGRKQLLSLLDASKNPVAGGPKTFVVTGLGPPYLAAITTAQVTSGLVKFLDGASPAQAKKLRSYLGEQLRTFSTPIARGGLAIPAMRGAKGLAVTVDTRAGGAMAVNQHAVVLRALERVMLLPGAQNAALVKSAKTLGGRLSTELAAELEFAYPAKGRMAYSIVLPGGKPHTGYLEDGNHLKTTLDALKDLQVYRAKFQPVVHRVEKRFPEIAFASPEDLSGEHGQIYRAEFNAFRALAHNIERKSTVTAHDVAKLEAFAKRDGLRTSGEAGVIARVKARVS